jgi:CubicO group peptidase (beta-lactamase class C family)
MRNKTKFNVQKVILIGIIIQLTFLLDSFGQTKAEKIDELMRLYNEYGQFNGSVLVAENGKVIFKKGFGMANMEWEVPNQPDTKHRLGSVTKQFTAMLILQLVEEGKLNLNVPITTYLPDYPKETGDIITIHHLLTHTSGIPNFTSFPNYQKELSKNSYNLKALIKIFSDSSLQFKPGEKFTYSNSGYLLLGAIIEKVSGKPYEQILHEKILNPLKMNNTGYDHHETILKNRASGYEKNENKFRNADYIDMSVPFSAGALYSTVEDLYLWDQALYNETLLPSNTRDLLFKPYVNTMGASYGYGWFVIKTPIGNTSDSVKVIGHIGGINGFNTSIQRIPSDKHLIVLLNNTGGAALIEMTTAIINILYNTSYAMPKRSIAFSLLDVINKNGLTSGLEHFRKFKNSQNYSLKENEMNSVGYNLLNSNKVTEAIEIFKLNVEAFPKSGNAYDSLGEAYLVDGNEKLAIENYKKSLELDPTNTNAKNVLKKLGVN